MSTRMIAKIDDPDDLAVSWIQKIHNGQDTIASVADELRYLARAFAITGNAMAAEQMKALGELLDGANKSIYAGVGDEIRQTMQATSASSASLVRAILSGAIVRPSGDRP